MGIVIVLLVIVVGTGWIAVRRRRQRQAYALRVPPHWMPDKKNTAHKAFVHGNTCLMERKFDEALAAFNQARKLDPQHPHIDSRLAEVERQQQAASAVASANATY